jgi:hypothetical protein
MIKSRESWPLHYIINQIELFSLHLHRDDGEPLQLALSSTMS